MKVLNAPVQRTDKAGHDYYQQVMVLEAKDGEGSALWAVSLSDEMQQSVKRQEIQAGSLVEVNLVFDTFTSSSGFVGNKVNVNAIDRLGGQQGRQAAPQVPGQGSAQDFGFANMQGYNPTTMH